MRPVSRAVLAAACLGFAITLTATAQPVPPPKVDPPAPYFPTTVGTKRTVSMTIGRYEYDLTEEVTMVEMKDGVAWVTVKAHHADGTKMAKEQQTQQYQVTPTRVRHAAGKDEWKTVLDLEAKTWTVELPKSRKKDAVAVYTVGPEEEVTTPAGKFVAVPVVREVGRAKTTEWYARGVGVVKSVSTTEGKSVLKAFTPAPAGKK